jgi:HAD superfamily hydrolase (TIGR01549 family)
VLWNPCVRGPFAVFGDPCIISTVTKSRDPERPALAGAIFDIGGTLIYPSTHESDCVEHLSAWLRARGWPAEIGAAVNEARREIHESTRMTGRQYTTQEALRRILPSNLVDTAEKTFFEPELAGYRLFPHAIEMLQRLREAGLLLGCISNATSHWLIERIVDQFGFRPYLDPVMSSAGFGLAKPARKIFEHVLVQWNLEPAQVAMVGDTLTADIGGARAAGMRTLYVTMAPNPQNRHHTHIKPDADAATLEQAADTLLTWAGVSSARRR